MSIKGTVSRQKTHHTFSIDYVSKEDGSRYRGTFTCKRLSVKDYARIGVLKAQLSGGMHYDADHPGQGLDAFTEGLNQMIAQLQVSITDAPDWWDLDQISDFDLIGEVSKEVTNFESSFRVREQDDTSDGEDGYSSSSQRGSTGDKARSGSVGNVTTVVDEEIHIALEP